MGQTEHLAERPGPEDLADDRSGLDEGLLVGRERVEPGRDDALDGLRERKLLLGLGEHAHELLRVERISAGASRGARSDAPPWSRPSRRDETSSAVSSCESGASEIVVAFRLPPPQPGLPVEELGSCGAEDEERHIGRPFGHLVDEVEQAVVRPVEILEDEDERPLLGERLEEAPPGRERLGRVIAAGLGARSEARERAEVAFHPAGLPDLVEDVLDGRAKLGFGRLGVVALQDPGLRLGHLAQRPEGDAVAVRQ